MHEALESVLGPLRPGFNADGFDVAVDSIDPDGVVVIRVGHRPNACEECLIPDDMQAPCSPRRCRGPCRRSPVWNSSTST